MTDSPAMAHLEVVPDGPYDLVGTLGPLLRSRHDPSMRLLPGAAWLALRRPAGPVTLHVRQLVARPGRLGTRLFADAWGPGADDLESWLPAALGAAPGTPWTGQLIDAPDRAVAALARRRPGIRIPATGAVLDALVPAILEQKVTGTEARRAWYGLIRAHGEPAPRPDRPKPSATGGTGNATGDAGPPLRLRPTAAELAALPYYAYHPFGVEQRRAQTIRRVASRADWFEACARLPVDAAAARLRSVPGVGPWTAAEVAVRALGDPDAVSVGDFHLPHLVSWTLAGEPRADDARMLELLAPYAGRRALVVRLLESSGRSAPRYGPRMPVRRIDGI